MYAYSICYTARKVMAKYKSLACCAALLNLALAPLVAAAESTLPIQPALGEGCSYSLTPAQQDAPNVLTFYSYTLSENGEFVLSPQYYQLNLLQTQYGQPDAENIHSFSWDFYNSEWFFENIDDYDPEIWADGVVIMYRYHSEGADERLEVAAGEEFSEDIVRDFVSASNSSGSGGAINNTKGTINTTITGDFIGNYASSYGGSIYNTGEIGSVIGDYVGNHSGSYGGAIYNSGNIASLVGDYLGNYAGLTNSYQIFGGALYNSGNIGSLKGDFIGNYIVNGAGIAYGGALYNAGTITSLTGDFIGNSLRGSLYIQTSGGAIYNTSGTIDRITGNFVGNGITGDQFYSQGGAIYNYRLGFIKEIVGDFIGNYVYGSGGAISNNTPSASYVANIGSISGNFIGNRIESNDEHATKTSTIYGGAIYNYGAGTIASISGDFIGNSATGNLCVVYGGAIVTNGGTIEEIIGDFIGNSASSVTKTARGGAIVNAGAIGKIYGNFIGNFATSGSDIARGGAIYSMRDLFIGADGNIGDGKAVFRGNYIMDKEHSEKYYQAIYIDNTAVSPASSPVRLSLEALHGGEIYIDDIIEGTNNGYIVLVSGDSASRITFNQVIKGANELSASAVMLNLGVTDGGSTDYTAQVVTEEKAYQYVSSLLSGVTNGVVLNENVTLNTRDARATNYTFTKLTTDSTAKVSVDIVNDGAGYELSIIDGNGDTKTVNASKSDRFTVGKGSTGKISLSSLSISGASAGEDIYAQIIHYTGDDAASYREENDEIIQLSGEDLDSLSSANREMSSHEVLVGRAELLTSNTWHDTIHVTEWKDALEAWAELEVDAGEKKVFTIANGDTVLLPGNLIGDDITIKGEMAIGSTLDLVNNQLPNIGKEKSLTLANLTLKNASALKNEGTLTFDTVNSDAALTVTNLGTLVVKGAWQMTNTITGGGNVTIDAELVTISGTVEKQNITHSGESETHLVAKDGTFSNFTDNSLKMESGNLYLHAPAAVAAVSTYSLVRPMAASSTIGAVSLGSSTLNLDKLTLGNGNIYVGTVEVNLAEKTMGRIVAKEYETTGTGKIYVRALAANKHDNSNETSFAVKFADAAIAAHVVPFENEPQQGRPTDGSPWVSGSKRVVGLVFEWDVAYSYDSGEYLFSRDGSTPGTGDDPGEEPNTPDVTPDVSPDNPPPSKDKDKPVGPDYNPNFDEDATPPRDPGSSSGSGEGGSGSGEGGSGSGGYTPSTPDTDSPDEGNNTPGQDKPSNPGSTRPKPHLGVNPSVMAASVAGQSAFFSMAQVLNHSFGHADMYSTHLALEHRKRRNGAMTASEFFGRSYKPAYFCAPKPQEGQLPGFKGGISMNAYASFEKLSLNGVPETDLDMYGAVVTGSTDLHEYENGMASVFSVHAAYMGARQKFSRAYYNGVSSVRTNQNGGAVGATFTLYKGGFYSALSASFGSAGAHSTTMSGSENFRSYMAGVASRSGYSIALGNSGVVLQPTLQISYMHVSTEDFTDPSGVYMDSDPMNVIQLNPYLKVIAHTSSGWDPFATGGYVRNLMGESKVQAKWDTSSYTLPEISVDSYWEYSLGIQKTWADLYTFYGQVTGRSGDRKGVEVSAGLRWAW